MPTSTRKNGITLIALIITIIVMLILVGVTINVALNGGLFDKAKTASDETQKEADREALISAVIGTLNNDGTVNLTELQAHLPDDFVYLNGIYTNRNNGKQYTVNSTTGKVEEYKGEKVYKFTIEELFDVATVNDGILTVSKTDFANLIGATSVEDILSDYGEAGEDGVYTFAYNSSYESVIPNAFSYYTKFMNNESLAGLYFLEIDLGLGGDTNNIQIIVVTDRFDEADLDDFEADAVDAQGNSIELTLVTMASLQGE